MEDKIKITIRRNLPETNSSSSHSLVIDSGRPYDPVLPGNPLWDIPIDQDGYLHIDGLVSFGREYARYNSVLAKVQYVCGALCGRVSTERESHPHLKRLERILTDMTGTKGVVFDWVKAYYSDLFRSKQDLEESKGEDPRRVAFSYYDPSWPDIDHQGYEVFDELLESDDTIRDFIFNPKSTLFTGSDECSPGDPSFYGPSPVVAYLQIYIPEPIGRIDIPLYRWPCKLGSADLDGWASPVKMVVFDSQGHPRTKDERDNYGPPAEAYASPYFYYFDDFGYIRLRDGKKILYCRPKFYQVVEEIAKELGKKWPDEDTYDEAFKRHPELIIEVPYTIRVLEFNVEYATDIQN